ncbi:cytochrome b5 reductase 4 isoform X1 [Chiloscyllium plagiosum]|uniref:cytochrome b5 reductase 4 isoform X1 n=1 Tax=Chiloscyllium plagiosum TaxID=36176 RepID=UPI001CB80EB6|nr:cytochrome b5 reductase 4 isoform X1 [Chiloscyllium plagiosum]
MSDATPQFPAPRSQQRVSAGGRKKVQLKPGRSLMDWIRLTKSGKDMTGLHGRLIAVTEEELAKHNKKTDCWMCIRGMVYNVTSYLEYHPGGEEELMRGAGGDGTELFDQIHSWVNYESMLKECLVGRMASRPKTVSEAIENQSGLKAPKQKLLNGTGNLGGFEKQSKNVPLRHEWFQTEDTITVVIYTKQKVINLDSIIVDLEGGVLRTEVRQQEYSYILHLELCHEVQEAISVHCTSKVGKIELNLKKHNSIIWNDLGYPQELHNSYKRKTDRGLFYRKCTLLSKTDVSHDTRLLCFQLPPGCYLTISIGQHVYLKSNIQDVEVVRPYTPVLPTLYVDPKDNGLSCTNIYLMVKIYPDGLLTPLIDRLQIGDCISVSSPEGNFKQSQLEGITELILLAAGTGFTPMIKLINFALKIPSFRKLQLLFFNKTEEDILWRDQLDQLALKDKRFTVEYILSEPHPEWRGKRGKIEMSLCSEFLTGRTEELKTLLCICGPTSFTEQAVGFFKQLGFNNEEIHAFSG